jgi:hypothetical protein
MRHKDQFLALLIPFDGHARGVIVLDACVYSHIKRLPADDARMMRLIDARIPHFRCDEGFLGRRSTIFVKAQVCAGAERLLLTVVGLCLPGHSWLVIPVSKNARCTVGVVRQIGMDALALSLGVLIGADDLLVQIHEQFAFALEAGIGGNEPDRIFRVGPGVNSSQSRRLDSLV